jgi:hypothetical protein
MPACTSLEDAKLAAQMLGLRLEAADELMHLPTGVVCVRAVEWERRHLQPPRPAQRPCARYNGEVKDRNDVVAKYNDLVKQVEKQQGDSKQ